MSYGSLIKREELIMNSCSHQYILTRLITIHSMKLNNCIHITEQIYNIALILEVKIKAPEMHNGNNYRYKTS